MPVLDSMREIHETSVPALSELVDEQLVIRLTE